MTDLAHSIPCRTQDAVETEVLLTREWLVANGLGGYASGTVSGVHTRRYHGLLISALPAPLGRVVMLNDLAEQIVLPDGTKVRLGQEIKAGSPPQFYGPPILSEFRLESGLPVWLYTIGNFVLEKRLLLPHLQNSVHIIYRMVSGDGPVGLELWPAVHFRMQEAIPDTPIEEDYSITLIGRNRYEISSGGPVRRLRIALYGQGPAFIVDNRTIQPIDFWMEEMRGYYSKGNLWSPGHFHLDLQKGQDVALVASSHSWETMLALKPEEAILAEKQRREHLISLAHPASRTGTAAELVLASDQFVIKPAGRKEDAARAQATGYELHSVIAGYHWFTDWGRDTMISLEGLTLTTGRYIEAGSIIRTFAYYIRDGLIPNVFPEGEKKGLYHTADATLWFFHAIDRYLAITKDRAILQLLIPKLLDVVDHHIRGTRFNIKVDPVDGLLSQGQEGYQLTWMDAKVDGWVVTPRAGKAVEINALWYNALRLLETWVAEEQGNQAAAYLADHAARAYASFNDRFWYSEGGYLYDVVDGRDGDDPACRPNQVLSISLSHPVLEPSRWDSVMNAVSERLLTPVGLRSLSPDHPDYKPTYSGDIRSRDAAYHQGTVWAWLIGPYIDAWLKLHPQDKAAARRLLLGFVTELEDAGIGFISEIFNAEEPHTPRGCIAQAWSVAEVLRCWVKTDRRDDPE
ncbi:MAG: amylo-alpha-1,6-glucosidase [Desulfomonilaceae bacterium]